MFGCVYLGLASPATATTTAACHPNCHDPGAVWFKKNLGSFQQGAMPKAAKKRPAAAGPDKADDKVKKPRQLESLATQTGMVSPEKTVELLCQAAGLVRTEKQEQLEWGSAFDGSNMPGYTLGLLRVPAKHTFGSEKAAAPAYFSLANFSMLDADGHWYEDHCWKWVESLSNRSLSVVEQKLRQLAGRAVLHQGQRLLHCTRQGLRYAKQPP